MSPLYNIIFLLVILTAIILFGIGIYKDSKKSMADLEKKKDHFNQRVREEAARLSKQKTRIVH